MLSVCTTFSCTFYVHTQSGWDYHKRIDFSFKSKLDEIDNLPIAFVDQSILILDAQSKLHNITVLNERKLTVVSRDLNDVPNPFRLFQSEGPSTDFFKSPKLIEWQTDPQKSIAVLPESSLVSEPILLTFDLNLDDKWEIRVGNPNLPRLRDFTITALSNENLIIAYGGLVKRYYTNEISSDDLSGDVWLYSFSLNQWKKANCSSSEINGAMPSPRYLHTAIDSYVGVLVFGGIGFVNETLTAFNDMWILAWKKKQCTWSKIAQSTNKFWPSARFGHNMFGPICILADCQRVPKKSIVYLYGGFTGNE